jgi:acetyl-CoA C-acetyltransferase
MSARSGQKRVYIVDGARTPFLKAPGAPGAFAAADLAVAAGSALLARQTFEPDLIDQVILGCMMPSENEANIARIVAVRLGLGEDTPGWTVQRNCGSGLQAVDCAYKDILMGRSDMVLTGGTETMSRAPLLWQPPLVKWFAALQRQKTAMAKLKHLSSLKLKDLAPVIALKCGLTDPLIGLNMGQTVEQMIYEYGISREQMDAYATESHQFLANAVDNNYLQEIVPIFDKSGKVYEADDGLRRDSSIEKLAKLKPYIEKPYGQVTAGNSSQITDGAALMLLASEEAVRRHDLPVLGRIVDLSWAACDPLYMGLGPVFSSTKIMRRNHLGFSDIDYWEINEAFAGQVLSCQHVWENQEMSQQLLKTDAWGSIARDRLNVDGGSIALGHPVGATGARITLHMLHVLQRMKAKRAISTLCIGGGQGGAVLLENPNV